MTALQNRPQIKVQWDQRAYEELRETWSQDRIEEDTRLLKEIFNLASRSPTLKQALDWAEQHEVKFFVDRTVVPTIRGYYKNGQGVIAVSTKSAENRRYAAYVLTHEIRHAWQDYHGLLRPYAGNFTDYNIRTSLIEADACAFGNKARDELRVERLKRLRKDHPERVYYLDRLKSSLADESTYLKKLFLWWFSSQYPASYGEYGSKYIARSYGLCAPRDVPKRHYELNADRKGLGAGMDLSDLNSVMKLGGGFFGGKNYLAQLPKETLLKKILSPSLSKTFYGAANDDQRKLTSDLRKAYLRKKLVSRRSRNPFLEH